MFLKKKTTIFFHIKGSDSFPQRHVYSRKYFLQFLPAKVSTERVRSRTERADVVSLILIFVFMNLVQNSFTHSESLAIEMFKQERSFNLLKFIAKSWRHLELRRIF